MAMLNFDATQVEPDEGQLDPVPTDWYNLVVDQSEIKPTKDNNGNYMLSIRISIVDGKYANRKIFERFNIKNSNPTAQEIAYKQLSALAHAVGVLNVQDSQQLHNIPFRGRVKLVPTVYESDGITVKYGPKNEMGAYRNINDQTAGNPTAQAQGSPFAAPVQGNPFATVAQPTMPQPQAVQQQWQPPAQAAQPWQQPQQQVAAQAVPQVQQVAPQQQAAPQVMPWQPPAQPAPQQQPAPVQQPAPIPQPEAAPQQPQWAQQAAPTPQQQQTFEQPSAPAAPPVNHAEVQAAQSSVPPWMKQPA